MGFRVKCPKCGEHFTIPLMKDGDHVVQCPRCGEDLNVHIEHGLFMRVQTLDEALEEALADLEAEGLIERVGDGVRLTGAGFTIAQLLIRDLIHELREEEEE